MTMISGSINRLPWPLVIVCFLCPPRLGAESAPYYQSHFPPEEFRARWERIFERIGTNSVAIVQGMAQVNGFIFPRQNNEFYYLCGIETPHSYLVLDGKNRKAVLYMPPRNRRLESAEGRVLSAAAADLVKKLTGADEVLSTEAMKEDQMPQVRAAQAIYTLHSPAEGAGQSRSELSMANESIAKESYAGSNPDEFFAELTMWYFGTHGDLHMSGPKPGNGPDGLEKYDPDAYALLDDFYSGRIEITRAEPTMRRRRGDAGCILMPPPKVRGNGPRLCAEHQPQRYGEATRFGIIRRLLASALAAAGPSDTAALRWRFQDASGDAGLPDSASPSADSAAKAIEPLPATASSNQ